MAPKFRNIEGGEERRNVPETLKRFEGHRITHKIVYGERAM